MKSIAGRVQEHRAPLIAGNSRFTEAGYRNGGRGIGRSEAQLAFDRKFKD